jgi:thiamine-monophosphate kinase
MDERLHWLYSVVVPLPEKALIAQVRRLANSSRHKSRQAPNRTIINGIGDDCAVLRVGAGLDPLVTTDFTLEGVHFRRDWHPPESVGHRCLARGLSDIAAMGGEPIAVFLSLALPHDLQQSWVNRFITSLTNLAYKHGATLAGGDTAQSPAGILADIVVLGTVPQKRAILRSGARPGDRIYVSGELGGSAAAVARLRAHPKKKLDPRAYPRHFYPETRLELGRFLREKNLVSAMIDTSDGLSTDLAHICEESAVGAEVESSAIPLAHVGKPAHEVDLELALHGGEDYELLFTVPEDKRIPSRIAGVKVAQIGKITRSRGIFLKNSKGQTSKLRPQGWEHFRK